MTHCLTPKDVCERLKISMQTVLGLIRSKRLPATNISSSKRPKWLIREIDLERMLTPDDEPQEAVRRPRRRRLDEGVKKVV